MGLEWIGLVFDAAAGLLMHHLTGVFCAFFVAWFLGTITIKVAAGHCSIGAENSVGYGKSMTARGYFTVVDEMFHLNGRG